MPGRAVRKPAKEAAGAACSLAPQVSRVALGAAVAEQAAAPCQAASGSPAARAPVWTAQPDLRVCPPRPVATRQNCRPADLPSIRSQMTCSRPTYGPTILANHRSTPLARALETSLRPGCRLRCLPFAHRTDLQRGRPPSTCSQMRCRPSFPGRHWPRTSRCLAHCRASRRFRCLQVDRKWIVQPRQSASSNRAIPRLRAGPAPGWRRSLCYRSPNCRFPYCQSRYCPSRRRCPHSHQPGPARPVYRRHRLRKNRPPCRECLRSPKVARRPATRARARPKRGAFPCP